MYLTPKVAEIRERRLAANLSQHGLSLKAGLGGQAINRIEAAAHHGQPGHPYEPGSQRRLQME